LISQACGRAGFAFDNTTRIVWWFNRYAKLTGWIEVSKERVHLEQITNFSYFKKGGRESN
jgi:hypothetical protein